MCLDPSHISFYYFVLVFQQKLKGLGSHRSSMEKIVVQNKHNYHQKLQHWEKFK